jgi:hypothetical protein
MPRPLREITRQACRVLSLNNRELAEYVGISVRTVQRHISSGGIWHPMHHQILIRGLYAKDRPLAAEYAAALGTSLVALGLESPLRAPAPSVAPSEIAPARPEQGDAVVYAAADALGMAPKAARPAVVAAFARAAELGIELAALGKLFSAERTAKPVRKSS